MFSLTILMSSYFLFTSSTMNVKAPRFWLTADTVWAVSYSCFTWVRGQVSAGSRAVHSSCVIFEGGRLLVVLHDGLQVSGSLLIAEVKGQGQATKRQTPTKHGRSKNIKSGRKQLSNLEKNIKKNSMVFSDGRKLVFWPLLRSNWLDLFLRMDMTAHSP